MAIPGLDKLKGILLNSGIQKENAQLFQVINSLIDYLRKTSTEVAVVASSSGSSPTDITFIEDARFLTSADESVNFPNSRQLLAGTNITFDDTVANRRTINATGGSAGTDHVVVSDGTLPIPSAVDDGFGNFVYVAYSV